MLNKHRKLILIVIIFLGFCLRYYAAASIAINNDERNEYPSIKEISFESGDINLPLVSKNIEGSIGYEYLVRIGWYLFGDSLQSARLPFIILGTLTILIVYFITKLALGSRIALLASFLLSISQYHISLTKSPEDDGIMFFGALSLFLFYAAIKNSNKKLMLLNGLVLGLGYWFKEYILILIPVYIIFLIVCSEYRIWLRSKYIWISFITAFCLLLPNFYLNLSFWTQRMSYIHNVASVGISMNAIGTYLGELILLILKPFPEIFELAASSRDSSISLVTFVFGFVILIAVVRSIKDKKPFVQLLLVCFLVNFIIFSFVRAVLDGLNSIWCFGNMDWVCLSFIPGVILAANMLVNCIKKYGYIGKLLLWFLMIFMAIRAVDYITFPLNCQVPIRNFQIRRNELCNVEMYLEKGDSGLAKDILGRIFEVTDKRPALRKMAVSKLFQILTQEGKDREEIEYSPNTFSQDFDNGKFETKNASDIANLVNLESVIASGPIMDLTIEENLLYVAAGSNGIYIYDISNSQNPQKISSIISNDWAYSISILDDFLYSSDGDAGFYILDISNPTAPKEISSFDSKGITKDAFIDNNYAYLACGKKGLYILDISDPSNPKEISHFNSDGDAKDIFIDNNYAYLACNNVGFYILDISDPSNLKEIFCFEGEDFIEDIYIYRNYVYLLCRDAGFYTLDISNSSTLKEVSRFSTDGFIEDITIIGKYAYLACEESGFYILDISDILKPKEIFHFEFENEDYSEGIFVNNNYAYLACEESGFHMFDISDPANSKEIFRFDNKGIAEGVFIRGNYAYLVCDEAGLSIIDISQPFAPKEVSSFDVNCEAVDVFVYNDYAYLACEDSGLYIVDISDPYNPKEIFQFDINDSIQDVFIHDNYAYLACEKSGLRVLDISNVFNLKETLRFSIDGFAECIFMDKNYIYLGYEKTKVHTLDIRSFIVDQKD